MTSAMRARRSIVVPRGFNGPPDSGNGGYAIGEMAGLLVAGPDRGRAPWLQVTLRAPVPLETDLDVDESGSRLLAGDRVVMEGRLLDEPPAHDFALLTRLPDDEVAVAERAYLGLRSHPFPTCFVCGPDRDPDQGYRLRPGRVGACEAACSWRMGEGLVRSMGGIRDTAVWAALDCPGAWSTEITSHRPIVLGRMAGTVRDLPEADEPCQVRGRWLRSDGRKRITETAAFGADGRLLGRALATWIEIPRASGAFLAPRRRRDAGDERRGHGDPQRA